MSVRTGRNRAQTCGRSHVRLTAAVMSLTIPPLFLCCEAQGQAQAQEQELPFVPTPHEVVQAMIALASPGADDVLVDLGSGDGRIVLAAAQRGMRARGIEMDANLVRISRQRAESLGVSHLAEFRGEDLFTSRISDATIVALYLLPEANERLSRRLISELRPGSRIVSHAFDMGAWNPDSAISVMHAAGEANVYLWTVPAQMRGVWELTAEKGEPTLRLDIAQSYQQLSGSGRLGDAPLRIVSGVMRGNTFAMLLDGGEGGETSLMELRGTVTEAIAAAVLIVQGARESEFGYTGARLSSGNEPRPSPK